MGTEMYHKSRNGRVGILASGEDAMVVTPYFPSMKGGELGKNCILVRSIGNEKVSPGKHCFFPSPP